MFSLAIATVLYGLAAAVPTAPFDNSKCNQLAENSGASVPGSGSQSDYILSPTMQSAAQQAVTPANYTQSFVNTLGAAAQTDYYLTYTLLSSYNTTACALQCSSEPRCQAFNVYFARDPKFTVGPGCDNPPPVTNIRCSMFTTNITSDYATNKNQYITADLLNTFERVQVGSNGYNKNPIPPKKPTFKVNLVLPKPAATTTSAALTPSPTYSFTLQDDIGNAAIFAAVAGESDDAFQYQTVKSLQVPYADAPAECAKQCYIATQFNKKCTFFNIYQELVNGINVQSDVKCALYAQVYGLDRAKNTGYLSGDGPVTITGSRTFTYQG